MDTAQLEKAFLISIRAAMKAGLPPVAVIGVLEGVNQCARRNPAVHGGSIKLGLFASCREGQSEQPKIHILDPAEASAMLDANNNSKKGTN